MICPNCGKELHEEDIFCSACGTRVAPVEEEIAETVTVEETVAEDVAAAETPTEEVSEEELEETEESFEDVMKEASALIGDMEEEPEETVEPAEPVYSTPIIVEEKPKRGGKAAKILIPIIVVLLLAAAAFGAYMWAETTYEQANAALQQKNYEQALELYGKFSFYKDCQEQISFLNGQQEAYDDAAQLVTMNQYVQSRDVLRALGSYRDSQELLNTHVPYLQAQYLMACAANNDSTALPQHPGYQEGTAYSENVAVFLYQGAADLLEALGDYEDAATLSSQCYSQMAFAYMEQGLFEDALACQNFMNETDKAAVVAQYMTYCADEGALAALTKSVQKRAELEAAFAEDPEMTHLELVEIELELLADYKLDQMYYDAELKELVAAYITGLETELSALDTNGFWSDRSTWYAGTAVRCSVIETLIEKYDFLGDQASLQASFAGQAAKYQAFSLVEKAIDTQILKAEPQSTEEEGDFYTFENTTGYDFTLVVTHTYTDEEGETVLFHETETLTIGKDETVNVPLMQPEEGEAWADCTIAYTYEITLN